ncbi:YwqG family protein [Aquimarina rhabdastrellae]
MIPKILKKYETALKAYERTCIRIKANPREENPLNDDLKLTESKFLGKPFFPINKQYPKDKNEKPMVMLAQINFEEIPKIDFFPTDGILQLFFSATEWYDEDVKIIYHEKETLNEPSLKDFSFLTIKDYEEIPIDKLHKLHFEKGIDKGSSEDSQFDFLFNGIGYWDFIEQLKEEEENEFNNYFDATGHKIGGYADFTQYDPREYSKEQENDIQLLQIDVDDYIMFGDSGIAHIFIDKESLIKKDFSKAYFYWDCC